MPPAHPVLYYLGLKIILYMPSLTKYEKVSSVLDSDSSLRDLVAQGGVEVEG